MSEVYLAIDIGASSGRHIAGWMQDGEWKTDEVYRFPNGMKEEDGHLTWDIEHLTEQVKAGIDIARGKYDLASLAIDTWGVDYVLMKGDEEVLPCYAYRDSRTEEVIPKAHRRISFSSLYRRTGIQFLAFNTIYQLYADKLAGRLEGVTDYLMMPEYLMYRLCGAKVHEFTIATTTGMINSETGTFDPEIIGALGLPEYLFKEPVQPGTIIGEYKGISCVLCAMHDTASAVEGIPMKGNHPYISSGTWSLMGIKSPVAITDPVSEATNWSNEGGVGYIRYLKNLMGMWIINRLREELCPGKDFGEIAAEAQASTFDGTFDVNSPVFLAPASMKEAYDSVLSVKPRTEGDYFRSGFSSLALSYRNAERELENNTGRRYEEIYIVGGGARNRFLNELTEEVCGRKVTALPIEATALGNLKIQREAMQKE